MRGLLESLEVRRLLSGVTLVTHGYTAFSNTAPAWVGEMAQDIAGRAGTGASVYKLHINGSGTVDSFTRLSGPGPASGSNAETVILLDWAAASGVLFPYYSTGSLAQAIAPWFQQAFPDIGISQPLAQSPIHLIGHSRGASLVSALAGELGKQGLWVDQLTTLDPHPVSSDAPVVEYGNVLFADNYYQTVSYPDGAAVSGAHNTDLSFLSLGHSGIHAYYDGTVDLAATDDGDGISISPAWYTYATTGPRDLYGFHWSRIAGNTDRPLDGAASAYREPWTVTATGASVWDNVVITDRNTDVSVTQGATLPFTAMFYDINKDATITADFDTDANPYNGTATSGLAAYTNTTWSVPANWNASVSTAGLAPGVYRLFTRITNGTRTRYYYAPGKVTVNADTTPPNVTAVYLRGSAWAAGMLSSLATSGLGDSTLGYRVPVGSGAQLKSLPWGNLDQISVTFSEDVAIDKAELSLLGVSIPSYDLSGAAFTYSPQSRTATWTLAAGLGSDMYTLKLNADGGSPIQDAAGNRLDGEWANPVAITDTGTDSYPSGNGTAGGDFNFRLNALPGDLNQDLAVDFIDLVAVAQNYGTLSGAAWAQGDCNGDGSVNFIDLVTVAQNYNTAVAASGVIAADVPATADASPVFAARVESEAADPVATTAMPAISAAPESQAVFTISFEMSKPFSPIAPRSSHGASAVRHAAVMGPPAPPRVHRAAGTRISLPVPVIPPPAFGAAYPAGLFSRQRLEISRQRMSLLN